MPNQQRTDTSAPDATRTVAMSSAPAEKSGICSHELRALGSLPRTTCDRTTSWLPILSAQRSGVLPNRQRTDTSAPDATRTVAMSAALAERSGICSHELRALGMHPRASTYSTAARLRLRAAWWSVVERSFWA
ncbi:MAG TPA: hypothetical protein VLH79_16395, partial [Chthonomonadales bacterium]|nr:hypothetical protein [Chthonomonadales bacterium]